MGNNPRRRVVATWVPRSGKNAGTRYKIRKHADNRFTVISDDFWGRFHSYGDFKSLAEAKRFCKTYDGHSTSNWKEGKKESPRRRMVYPKKVRKFNGLAYRLRRVSKKKSIAEDFAKRMRTIGAKARLVKTPKGGWAVYVRVI